MTHAFFQFIHSDEIVSPVAFMLFGILGLTWFSLMNGVLRDPAQRRTDSPLFRATLAKFESRSQISWILLVFGVLWLLQTLVEKSWAA